MQQIAVRFRHVRRTPQLERYVEWRLTSALDRLDAHLGSVVAHLDRVGPRQIACRISVHVLPDRHLSVESRSADPLDAVDCAAHQAAEAAERALGRIRWRRHARAS